MCASLELDPASTSSYASVSATAVRFSDLIAAPSPSSHSQCAHPAPVIRQSSGSESQPQTQAQHLPKAHPSPVRVPGLGLPTSSTFDESVFGSSAPANAVSLVAAVAYERIGALTERLRLEPEPSSDPVAALIGTPGIQAADAFSQRRHLIVLFCCCCACV